METITVPRTFGGVVLVQEPFTPPTLQQAVVFRDGEEEATHRDGNATEGGR